MSVRLRPRACMCGGGRATIENVFAKDDNTNVCNRILGVHDVRTCLGHVCKFCDKRVCAFEINENASVYYKTFREEHVRACLRHVCMFGNNVEYRVRRV
jgi:hypothetical protein